MYLPFTPNERCSARTRSAKRQFKCPSLPALFTNLNITSLAARNSADPSGMFSLRKSDRFSFTLAGLLMTKVQLMKLETCLLACCCCMNLKLNAIAEMLFLTD